jgi:hypothetical protein
MMREQALGQMGIAWGASQNLLGKAEELAVKLAGKSHPDGTKMAITIPGGPNAPESTRDVEIDQLNSGDYCYEVDDSFPDTRAMRRAVFNSLIAASQHSPALQSILALPENQALFKEMVDPDLEIPGADARLQQKREIDKLLSEKPIPPTPQMIQQALLKMVGPALQAGQVPPPPPPQVIQQITQSLMQPSVPIDAEWDFNELHEEEIQDWLAGNECYQEIQKGNIGGVQNVKLHGMLHKNAIKAQQQPPPVKPPSESINYADVPPSAQIQMLAKDGITITPQDLAQQKLAAQSTTALKPQGGANA